MNKNKDKIELALKCSKDICLAMIAQRVLSPDKLTEALNSIFTKALEALALESSYKALTLKCSKDITKKLVEQRMIANPIEAANILLKVQKTVIDSLKNIDEDLQESALSFAKDCILKMLESNQLNAEKIHTIMKDLCFFSSQLFKK